jgi:hypothetical protein
MRQVFRARKGDENEQTEAFEERWSAEKRVKIALFVGEHLGFIDARSSSLLPEEGPRAAQEGKRDYAWHWESAL